MTKFNITNAEALTAVVAILKGEEVTIDRDELTAKIEHMAAQASKKRENNGPKVPTKEQLAAIKMAEELGEFAKTVETFATKDIMENIRYVTSPQKATAIAKRAMAMGLIEKVPSIDSKVSYRAC